MSGATIGSTSITSRRRTRGAISISPAREAVQPEVVYITTPPSLHKEQTFAALARGAHVVLEKPIALTVREAEEIGEAAARAGRMIHICHQLRYAAGSDAMRALLSGQKVALTHIWNYRKGPDIPGNWNRAWGGG